MRKLTIGTEKGDVNFTLSDENAAALLALDLVYECGEGHDLHLNPERDFDVEEVCAVLEAIEGIEAVLPLTASNLN